jgi:hypothetical protein
MQSYLFLWGKNKESFETDEKAETLEETEETIRPERLEWQSHKPWTSGDTRSWKKQRQRQP